MMNNKKMKKMIYLIICLLFVNNGYSQNSYEEEIISISDVDFKFKNSRRYAHNLVEIKLKRTYRPTKSITAHITSKPMNSNPKWENTKIDTIYDITRRDFDSIVNTVHRIQTDSIRKFFSKLSFDGVQTSIRIGGQQYFMQYGMANPSRKYVPNYYDASKMILELVGLDPKYIFGEKK